MNNELQAQRAFWNSEADAFQRIYTHRKSKFANTLDQIFRKDMYERFVFTIEHCEPIKGRTFLDVGCGNALYSLELARKGAAKVVGIDISEVMIGLCKKSAENENLADVCTFIQTDLLDYVPGTTFDVSFGIGLFDYISNPLPVLKRMREVSTDKAIMAFPRLWTWRAPVRKVRLARKGCDVFFYSKAKIEKLLRDAGFSRQEIVKVGKLYCVVAYP
ncbi:MAG TPA: class I SAM-dependent methyltransferase [Pyrinomonadaceae bacterium]|nr:class I SAM-dependent methyltransferase [Pyrinomonadaceae bacterium]